MMWFFIESEFQTGFITANVINCKVIFFLCSLNSTNQGSYGHNIMEYKNISSKFTLQTQKKYKNTKIKTCLHEISYCQNSDIRVVSIALVIK